MAVPTQKELHRPILEMVANAEGTVLLSDVKERMVSLFGLNDDDLQEILPTGKRRFDNRLYWAVSTLRRAGLVESPIKATFICTPEGHEFLTNRPGTIEIKELNALIDSKQEPSEEVGGAQPSLISGDSNGQSAVDLGDTTPDEQMARAFNQSRDKLVDDVLLQIRSESYSHQNFELLVLDLLRRMGYGEPQHTGKSGDGGIDGIINQDALGLEKVYVQAKRWANQVGEPEIRNFSGSLDPYGATKGVFITTSTFSSTARQTAQNISAGNKFIRLVDGPELARLMIAHGVGVVTEYTYEIKKLDENYFADDV